LFILSLATVSLLLVSIFSYLGSREALLETISTRNTSLTVSAAKGIRDQVLSYREVLESVGSAVMKVKTVSEKKDILIAAEEGLPFVESLAILNKDGEEIVRSDDKALKNRKSDPEFYIAKEKGIYVSWSRYHPIKKLSSIVLAIPLFKKGELKGILAADIYFSEIWHRTVISALSPKDNAYVFTREGQLVAKVTAQKEKWQSEDLEKIASEMTLKANLITEEKETNIGSMLVIASPVSVLNWGLVIFRPTAEIYKPASVVRNQAIIISILSLIFVFILTVFFTRLFVRPIRKLHEGAEIIGKGNLDYRVDIRTGDEIEQLAKEFNKMVEALKEERASLEIKVEARTKEIRELAESLEDKVKERTKQLQERINELERFHRLTVGREIKMVDLKKEIKELKKELEKYKNLPR